MVKKNCLLVLFISCFFLVLQAQENLIPMPKRVEWHHKLLDLSKGIVLLEKGEVGKSGDLARTLLKSWKVSLKNADRKKSLPVFTLEQTGQAAFGKMDESYRMEITKNGITIVAASNTGLFYGLQTLRQFGIKDKKIACASIEDNPAFSWRAFLLDVGRNYQPIEMLKEQIDVMAKYKLNVLHFHFTEDIAWRLVSKKYPGLTEASNMTRWVGDFYTEQEFRELIAYCKARHIRLLPEIDMPGHSAAFKRFFGVDMQSDSGIMYIKELLTEFKSTYPEIDMLHIGGDEVKINNRNFMPEITKYVEGLGYKSTIGWDPGSNLLPQTWRQLWMGGPKLIPEERETVFVDSKHLYINHMDPLETVTTLFHRKVGEQDREHRNLIGATLCSWPDRAVAKPIDMFYQSAVYPSILTFAERIWRGGGEEGWVCNILPADTKGYRAFKEFEGRLLNHKKLYFAAKPFPYVKQTGLRWDLIGPFANGGDLSRSFGIEREPYGAAVSVDKTVEGGTIILRHWWADILQGAVDRPQPNTTWYARTKIWSDKEVVGAFWIGFDNLSRSYASDSPAAHSWDNRQSKLWVNGLEVAPPEWKQPGLRGDLEKPLLDEGYSYREPTNIPLKKGWNEVLVKLPVKDFKGRSWDNPVKWMFTFVPVE